MNDSSRSVDGATDDDAKARLHVVGDESAPPVPGWELLDRLHALFTRYVIYPGPHEAVAHVLWTAATHGLPAWEHAPRLAILSPVKRCGKTRVLDLTAEACYKPLITINATIPALVRSISPARPRTLVVDEADSIFSQNAKSSSEKNEELRGLLNAGYGRGKFVTRWDITERKVQELHTFAMAALAAIKTLPDTIIDRSVVIRMRRRAPGEEVAPYRERRDRPPLNELRDEIHDWVSDNIDKLREAEPEMPLEDRAADTWEPLIAIADLAGGDWPDRARAAAVAMAGEEADPAVGALGIRLLADLRTVFGDADWLWTDNILTRLYALEESPWSSLSHGRPLDPRGLAALLREYEIKSRDIRGKENGLPVVHKGYRREEGLQDAWDRYL